MSDDSLGALERVWLITGCSSGLGRALLSAVLARDDKVIATARRRDKITNLTPAESGSENLRLLELDITSGRIAIEQIVETALSFWGRVDVVVNNAGLGLTGILEEGGLSLVKRQFETNVYGMMDVTLAILPHMRQRKSGTVVMIGSRSAFRTESPGIGTYGASKAAVHAIGETLAAELAPFSIRVLNVIPGAFRTGIYSNEPIHTANPIPDYDEMRKASGARYEALYGAPGSSGGGNDPVKAVNAVVDVVRNEGTAERRPWPMWLVLGEDALDNVRRKCLQVLSSLDEWSDVSKSVAMDN